MDKKWMKQRLYMLFPLVKLWSFFFINLLLLFIVYKSTSFQLKCGAILTLICIGTTQIMFNKTVIKSQVWGCKDSVTGETYIDEQDNHMECDIICNESLLSIWKCNRLQRISNVGMLSILRVPASERVISEAQCNSTSKVQFLKDESKSDAGLDILNRYSTVSHDEESDSCRENIEAFHHQEDSCRDVSRKPGFCEDEDSCRDVSRKPGFSKDEVLCKTIIEATSTGNSEHDTSVKKILEPISEFNKTSINGPNEDEESVDKHQILPPDTGLNALNCKEKCIDDTGNATKFLHLLEMTDDEFQKAANDFYTLEGDVLWTEADLQKQSNTQRLDSEYNCLRKNRYQFSASSEDFCIVPCKFDGIVSMPRRSDLIKNRDGEVGADSQLAEVSGNDEMDEDMIIDRELRAIAFQTGNRGEDSSNYMSTVGSFRDFLSNFNWDFESSWSELYSQGEFDKVTGCCDDGRKPCMTHSKSRSKVMQSDPLLSKTSIKKHQEFMDVLWQEYNEDMRQKWKNNVQQARCSSTRTEASIMQDAYDGNVHLNETRKSNCFNTNNDKTYRRRHFMRICKVLREIGLKPCLQSSKVDR